MFIGVRLEKERESIVGAVICIGVSETKTTVDTYTQPVFYVLHMFTLYKWKSLRLYCTMLRNCHVALPHTISIVWPTYRTFFLSFFDFTECLNFRMQKKLYRKTNVWIITPFLPGIAQSQTIKFRVPSGFFVGRATKPCNKNTFWFGLFFIRKQMRNIFQILTNGWSFLHAFRSSPSRATAIPDIFLFSVCKLVNCDSHQKLTK